MANPAQIYGIYRTLAAHAEEVRDFQLAKGEPVSSTVRLLCARDPAAPLARWAEEMEELLGVLDGTHQDSYLMEATQTFYWASLYAALQGATWEQLAFAESRRQAVTAFDGVPSIRAGVVRLAAMGVQALPGKLFLLWQAADRHYRAITPADQQWSVEQIMAADLAEMRKRPYLAPILALCPETPTGP